MMIDFFGTTPGLLSLAGLGVLLILISIVRRLAARARARRAAASSVPAAAPASPGFGPSGRSEPPRWVVAAVAAWTAVGEEPAPSAEAWKPAAGGPDPWLAAAGPARRNVGVTK
jgi:hypothetical protein